MNNPLIGVPIYVAVGAWIIWFARSVYRRPDYYLGRWFTKYILPPFRWTPNRLKGFAVIWIFSAVLMITAGFAPIVPPLLRVPLPVWLLSLMLVTFLLIPRRSQVKRASTK